MVKRRNNIKRWSWLTLFGFVWLQLGLASHLVLVAHDLDGHGRAYHSHKLNVVPGPDGARLHHSAPSTPQDKAPIAPADNCLVMHFMEHSAGLLASGAHVVFVQQLQQLFLSPDPGEQQQPQQKLFRLSPAQSPPRA